MKFPNLIEFIKYHNTFMITGPIGLCVALFFWGKIIVSRIDKTVQREKGLVFGAIAATIIAVLHLWGTYGSLAIAMRWRHIDPTTITSFRIERLGSEENAVGEPIIFDNVQEIRQGTALLSFAKKSPFYRSWEDGYRIQFRFSGEKEFSNMYLSAYRIGYDGAWEEQDAFGVIPHLGKVHTGSVNNGGEYICPQFYGWLTEQIEPLFPPLTSMQ